MTADPITDSFDGPVNMAAWRQNPEPRSNYLRLEIRHDGVTESRVVDGVVVASRELDSVPDGWPNAPEEVA